MPRPRVSLRRALLALMLVSGCLLLWLNVLQVTFFSGDSGKRARQEAQSGVPLAFVEVVRQPVWESSGPPSDNRALPQEEIANAAEQMDGGGGGEAMGGEALPWFVTGGERRPRPALLDLRSGRRAARLFPGESASDRIAEQLMFVPPRAPGPAPPGPPAPAARPRVVLLANGLSAWNVRAGRDVFSRASRCPVSSCRVTGDHAAAADADAIVYKDHFFPMNVARPRNQVWILYYLECPYHTPNVKSPEVFNWTATYRRDSDIVAPYEKWFYHNPHVTQVENLDRNYALNKTKKVAWFVSNCGARNHRLQYATELSKYIQVDIYGACGTMRCPRYNAEKCFDLLDKDYKFYLAFENSNCQDYITEKFFVNGLGRNILPIVMGARPEDYEVSAPYNSYIHVDEFESPKELAEYLHRLDKDDELYNSYFKWKGTGEFINTHFWCRMCALLHDDLQPRTYRDVNDWWRGHGVCTHGSWRKRSSVDLEEIDETINSME